MKQAALNWMAAAGVFAPFRLANRSRALILTYHRFSEGGSGPALSAKTLAGQIEYLAARYSLLPLSRIVELLRTGAGTPPGAAAITIDDGYRDAYEIAFPVLRRYGAPATLFVVTDFVDGKAWLWPDRTRYAALKTRVSRLEARIEGSPLRLELGDRASRLNAAERINARLKALPDRTRTETLDRIICSLDAQLPERPPDEFAPITWGQTREMEAAGVEIGSHTVTHPLLTKVSADRLRWEVSQSRSRLETELGHPIDLFCYPNGDYNPQVLREVGAAGYLGAVTCDFGFNPPNAQPLSLRRIHSAFDRAHFVQNVSGFEAWKNQMRYKFVKSPGPCATPSQSAW